MLAFDSGDIARVQLENLSTCTLACIWYLPLKVCILAVTLFFIYAKCNTYLYKVASLLTHTLVRVYCKTSLNNSVQVFCKRRSFYESRASVPSSLLNIHMNPSFK